MGATLIDGKKVAARILERVAHRVQEIKKRGVTPGLAAVLVGDNPASSTYVASKAKTCEKLGMYSEVIRKDASFSQRELEQLVRELNANKSIHGILVQSPLPAGLDEPAITRLLDPGKDVDGFHPYNVGMLLIGEPILVPCTPAGIVELLRESGVETSGKHVVVVGRSNIVGKPVAALLMQKGKGADATVTVAHSRTSDLARITREADILIAAIGRPRLVTRDMVKPGAVIIDVGINRVDDPTDSRGYKLVGDVDFEPVAEIASQITPVPGGVGPMTIAMLMHNTLLAAERSLGR